MHTPSVAAAAFAFLLASTAAAQAPDGASSEPVAERETWYGDELLVADGSAVLLATAGTVTLLGAFCMFDCHGNEGATAAGAGLAAGGLATYALAPPILHAAHGHWDKAGTSLGLRLAPTALAVPFYASGDDGIGRVGLGIHIAGSIAAAVIDDVLIAREPTDDTDVAVAPTYDPETRRFGLAASASF